MTPKKKVVLRTAFRDSFRLDETTTITQGGTEVDASRADEIVEVARRSGVALFEVADDPAPETKKTEGSGN